LLRFDDPDDTPVLYVDAFPCGMASSNVSEIERGRGWLLPSGSALVLASAEFRAFLHAIR
jgi:hypothetical protein